MGTRARSLTPDLFSTPRPAGEARSQSSESIRSPSAASRHILLADMPNAIRHLNDQELETLANVVIKRQEESI
jgi:hypothetical protein